MELREKMGLLRHFVPRNDEKGGPRNGKEGGASQGREEGASQGERGCLARTRREVRRNDGGGESHHRLSLFVKWKYVKDHGTGK